MQKAVAEALAMLGTAASDRVTGFSGMIASINFDAYGCIQAFVTPPAKENRIGEGSWFDLKRLAFGDRLFPLPAFAGALGDEQGGNDLPRVGSMPVPPGA